MARISKVNELEARKRALVAESELCREALKADVENLQDYCDGFFKKIDRVRSFGPWFMLAAPMAIPLFRMFSGRRTQDKASDAPAPPRGRLAKLLLGWRLYRQYSPMVWSLASNLMARRRRSTEI
jgi:hypothetical protein